MHILITGGTGFIGSALCAYFTKMGYTVSVLTRNATPQFNPNVHHFVTELLPESGPFDAIINLAGESLSKKRWNDAFKKAIYDSRINTTQVITNYIKNCSTKPNVLLSASAIGFYGDSLDTVFDENSAPTHDSFTQKLCSDWEAAAHKAKDDGVRVCTLRIGIVLEKNGGALAQLAMPAKLGLGAILGDGNQWMSWIHLQDVVGIIDFLVHQADLSGPFNLTAPSPVTNKEFTKTLSRQFNRPAFLSLWPCVAKLIFGEVAESLLLVGQKVIPKRISSAGYVFKYPDLEKALAAIY
jgi:uncharacterized protein (TIGR01777 family)